MSENVVREKWGVRVINKSRLFALTLAISFLIFYTPKHPADASEKISKNIELPEKAVSVKILGNGLSVLTAEGASDGLIAIHATVRAGPISEGQYQASGISHLVEHMLFKGTKTRGPGDIEKEIKSFGGLMNGAVSQDMAYYELVVPSSRLKESLSLLRDMLYNAAFDPVELEKEKEVILKEIRLTKDDPERRMARVLNERAYLRHPYKYPTIGYEANFTSLTREDLIRYYNMMYVPNRVAITITGDIEASDAMAAVENEFRDLRAADYAPRDSNIVEPAQIGARYFREEFPASLSYTSMAFHSTSLLNSDLYAMDVLAMILGRGDLSRLNTSLHKNKRLVHSVNCWNYTPKDPGLFVVSAVLDSDKLAETKDAITEELRTLQNTYVSDEELEGAQRMVVSGFVQSLESVEDRARLISADYILTGNPDFSSLYVKGVQNVTKEDIKRVANTYLKPENMTIVDLVPPTQIAAAQKTADEPYKELIHRQILLNGIRILLRENKALPTISITVAMKGGLMVEDAGNNGISNLTSRMLLKGTGTRREEMIKGLMERLGADLSAFSGMNSFGLSMFVLKPDLETGLDILKDVLTDPVFPQDEIDKEITLMMAAIKSEDDDIFARGFNATRKNLFGDSPYSLRYSGEIGSLESLKRDDLIKFYSTYCVPDNMVIAVSGDIDPDTLMKKIGELFGNLKPGKTAIEVPFPDKLESVKSETINMDRLQSLFVLGFQTTTLDNPDRYVLEVMGSIMSGSSGRLFETIRDKYSLAYTLGCVQKIGLGTGYMAFYIATTENNIPQAKKQLLAEIDRIGKKDVKGNELDFAKRELVTSRRLNMQSNDFFSLTCALDELYGLGYDSLYKYTGRIERVTKEDIKRCADKYLDTRAYSEVTIVPEKGQ